MKPYIALLLLALSASASAADVSAFDSFFRTVSQSKQAPAGTPLSESELRALIDIASDYARKSSSLNTSPVVFEARLRAAETGSSEDASAWEAEQLRAIEKRRAALLAAQIQLCRTTFGETRFPALDSFVEAWHKALLAAPRPVARK